MTKFSKSLTKLQSTRVQTKKLNNFVNNTALVLKLKCKSFKKTWDNNLKFKTRKASLKFSWWSNQDFKTFHLFEFPTWTKAILTQQPTRKATSCKVPSKWTQSTKHRAMRMWNVSDATCSPSKESAIGAKCVALTFVNFVKVKISTTPHTLFSKLKSQLSWH